ncbi:AI-2E family transporter [Oceaniglobus roseus]|uniref:AI-2E family transporter n=1 Tax=Oceaniglobus roseus TaxID=1737570 RepID=UPI001FEAE2F4|nr:AI-2E family transporter [Kandeliimicrobium roseum]
MSSPTEPSTPETEELRKIRLALSWLLVFVAFTVIYFARELMFPVFLGVMLALTFSPVVRGLGRIGIPAPATAVLVMLTLGTTGFVAAYFASGPISEWLEDLPAMGQELQYKLAGLNDSVEKIKDASKNVEEMATPGKDEAVREVAVDRPGFLSMAASGAMTMLTSLLVALVLATFLLASGTLFHEKLVQSFSRFEDKKTALMVVKDVERRISRYLLSITVINAGLGVCIGFAMWLVGMPNWLIWGLLAFLLNFLPFVGAVVGVILVAGVALLTFDSPGYALLAPFSYLMLTSIEGQFVTPTLLGRSLELNTVSVFLAVVLWGWLWGVPGALMAVPFLVTFKVLCDNVPVLRIVGNFLGSQSPLRDA